MVNGQGLGRCDSAAHGTLECGGVGAFDVVAGRGKALKSEQALVCKTAEEAIAIYRECKAYEDAGAFAVEIEVVPEEVATEISSRVRSSRTCSTRDMVPSGLARLRR